MEAALERGHEVTLFHRGEHGAGLFPDVERVRGDRGRDLGALRGRRWDAVVDTSAYVPRVAHGGVGRVGRFNVDGPLHAWTVGEVLEACREASGSDARLTWVDEEFLLDRGVRPWAELPFWVPAGDPVLRGVYDVSVERATAEGLSFRPLVETVRDTLEWDRGRPAEERGRKTWMARERERELLDAWRRHGTP